MMLEAASAIALTARTSEPDVAKPAPALTLVPPVPIDPDPEPSRGAAVTIRDLDKSFGAKKVLSGLSLDIPAGQFVAIVGRSGCGKSTLLRLLVGLDTPTSGEIAIDGEAGNARTAKARIVFQEPRLLPWAKVGENVAVGLGEGGEKSSRNKAIKGVLADVGLPDRINEWPSVLSGGQKQRVALARALVSQPRLLVLDEPLGALDALTRITMQALVERVWFTQGMTALLVTHDVSEAVALADRVIVLEEGRVALDVAIDLPRPRERSDPRFAAYEGQLLDAIFGVAETVF
jgi:sulfonate transport system ATP-binding protein